MAAKLPADAFDYYFSLGASRSYQAVADHYHVTKKSVTNKAIRENWQGRAEEIERKAQTLAAQKTAETLSDVRARHGKIIKAIQGKAIEALKSMPIDSAMDAVRSLDLAVRLERGHSPLEAEEQGTADQEKREGAINKFVRQSPIWMSEPLARAEHWGDAASDDEKTIAGLIGELCAWVEEFAARCDVYPAIPFHVLVLLTFLGEKNEATSGRMRKVIYDLEVEYEALRKERGIELKDNSRWKTLLIQRPKAPGESFNAGDTLTWREAFGTDCLDPVNFVGRWLKQKYPGET